MATFYVDEDLAVGISGCQLTINGKRFPLAQVPVQQPIVLRCSRKRYALVVDQGEMLQVHLLDVSGGGPLLRKESEHICFGRPVKYLPVQTYSCFATEPNRFAQAPPTPVYLYAFSTAEQTFASIVEFDGDVNRAQSATVYADGNQLARAGFDRDGDKLYATIGGARSIKFIQV